MRRNSHLLLIGIVLMSILSLGIAAPSAGASEHELSCEYPLEITDATGEELTLESAPDEIVTTTPSAAQTLWAIDAQDKVTGLTMHSMFLDGAADRTNVSADPFSLDIEAIVDLDPDLVLAPNVTSETEIDTLREVGLTVYHAGVSTSVQDVIEKTERLGTIVGECEATQSTVESLNDRLDAIDQSVDEQDEEPLVFYASGGGYTPGVGTFQHDAIERAGATNLAGAEDLEGWAPISGEVLIDEDPEWIIYPDSMTQAQITDAAQETTAWEEGQVFAIDANTFSQPAPDLITAIETIHTEIYGELDVATPTPDESTSAIPGFGIVLALVALVFLSLAIKRR